MIIAIVKTAKIQYIEAQGREDGIKRLRVLSRTSPCDVAVPKFSTRYEYMYGLRNDAEPKMNRASTELNAKFSSPPATRSKGLIAVCSAAMPDPIMNSDATATE